MTNADRISEVYKGEIWSSRLQEVARARIDWLVGHARGDVLDLGCSQGIASIQCARRGLRTLGIDNEAERIGYAQDDSDAEPDDVRERLTFRLGDARELEEPDGSFDTVLLGEVIEHLDDPAPVLTEVVRVLRPDGVLLLTTPFGYSPHHDHRATFYVSSLTGLLAPYVSVAELTIVDGYFRVLATPRPTPDEVRDALVTRLQQDQEEALLVTQQKAHEAQARLREQNQHTGIVEKRLGQVTARLARTESRLRQQEFRTQYVTWQFKVAKNRRWWRLGEALLKARKPSGLRRLPRALTRALKPVPRLPEPEQPAIVSPDQTGHFATVEIPEITLPDGPIARPELTVAVILDRFSATAFRYEWRQLEPGPDDWRETLERERPGLLFVESAWHGNDGRWSTMMSAAGAPKRPVRELAAWCRERGIPTVFWNKEDPPNFDRFIETAKLFDHVFTVDADCIPRYREILGHDRVALLPFGAQPRVHNPVSVPGRRLHEVAFAGTYHTKKYPGRAAQMAAVVSPARDFGLHIFSRMEGDPDFAWPSEYVPHVVGSLPYERMLAAYKAYKVFLNVNSVTESPTMCARRVFELSACATPVVSGWSRALEEFFGGLVPLSESGMETAESLAELLADEDVRDRRGHLAMRKVLGEDTYGLRVDEVLRVAGLTDHVERGAPSVSVILPTNRPGQVDHAIAQVAQQAHRPLQLVLVVHGFDPGDAEGKARAAGIEDVVVRTADAGLSLGGCLNLGVAAADGEFLAKMDDDNLYGPHYLGDLLLPFGYTDAAVTGKGAHYVRLGSSGVVILRFPQLEHTEAELVQGGTIVARGDLLRKLRFADLPRAVDSDLLRRVRATGAGIYSADRFNFVSVRDDDPRSHTWQISDKELMRDGHVAFHGDPADRLVF